MSHDAEEKVDHPLALALMYASIFVFGLSLGWVILNAIYG